MEQSVLKYIPTNNCSIYYEGWRNGKKGGFVLSGGVYYFCEMYPNLPHDYVIEKLEDNPVVAVGVVSLWLQFNRETDSFVKRLTRYNYIPEDINEMFEDYTQKHFYVFKDMHCYDPDTLDWDWEYEFYTKYIIPVSMELNKASEALFDYISDSDIVLIRKVMNAYIKYLKKCRSEKGYDVSNELKVLHAINYSNEFMLEDLENYEINAILDDLESKGYIKVAWVEGHTCEDVRLLDKGRVFMKRLETRMKEYPLTKDDTPPVVAPQKKNTSPSKKKEKAPKVVSGQHKTFPVISKEDDPYRKAQVFDLYVALSKKKKENGLELISTDLRDFIKCFTEGTTSSTIIWNGSIRQLHFIVYEWKNREHITFGKEDNVWDIASKVFTNPKKKTNGKPTFFDAEDLRKARSPKLVPQELEDIVEILNPKNISSNYEKFAQKAEERIKYGQQVRENGKHSGKTAWDEHMDHVFDDDEGY